eukprot:EC725354.1.p1 GENE.EC725354.1~~EC725354.1.p1  ORF type:complete len:122 (+),score=7.43 EC725354.1:121-486(+)
MAGAAAAAKVFQFKLVLLGDSAVGKSSLVLRFVRGQFSEYQESTIGAAFLTQTVNVNDVTVKFEVGNTVGREGNNGLGPRNNGGVVVELEVMILPAKIHLSELSHGYKSCNDRAARILSLP